MPAQTAANRQTMPSTPNKTAATRTPSSSSRKESGEVANVTSREGLEPIRSSPISRAVRYSAIAPKLAARPKTARKNNDRLVGAGMVWATLGGFSWAARSLPESRLQRPSADGRILPRSEQTKRNAADAKPKSLCQDWWTQSRHQRRWRPGSCHRSVLICYGKKTLA